MLTPQDLQKIFEGHQKVSFKKGQVANPYFVVESEMIRSYVYDFDGNDITTGFIGQNEIAIDVVSLFHSIPTVEYYQALTDCECYAIDLASFQVLYHSIRGLNEWGRAWMADSLFVNSVYKNGVQKIVFKSGRIQTFTERTSFEAINPVEDYENVTITGIEGEIQGLYKIGDVSSKAKGATTLSNQERVKESVYRKLKIEAAMMGANIVYLTDQRTEGNKMGGGGYFQSGSSAETNLSGVAYSNVLPNHEEFKKLVEGNTLFTSTERYKLWSSGSDVSKEAYARQFSISNIINQNGITIIEVF